MSQAFTRQLGYQPGVQLNPLRDNTDGFAADNADQICGIAMRATRGRIDKPFRVNQSNFTQKLGRGESMRLSALNEAYIHVGEALKKGAAEFVVQRLVTPSAVLSFIILTAGNGAVLSATAVAGVVTAITVVNGGSGFATAPTIKFTGVGTGATATAAVTNGAITAVTVGAGGTGYTTAPTVVAVPTNTFSVSATIPTTPFMLAIQLLDCVNEGNIIEFHADQLQVGGLNVDNQTITLRVRETTGDLVYEFVGSLDPNAKDDYGQSLYLPDVISGITGTVVVTVGAGAAVAATSAAYGRNTNGQDNVVASPVQVYFSEGGTGYATSDYTAAMTALKNTSLEFEYLSSGGSQAPALLSALCQLAIDTNRNFPFDIPGTLSPAAAIAFVQALNLDSHYPQAYWSPLKSDDPMGINGKSVIGTATFNIARRCLRNAQTDSKGFAPKNFPIAGKDWPLDRTGISQIYSPSDPELSDLAAAKINPVILQRYNGGSKYVFSDSLTCAKTTVSFKKLINVAEMSSTIDDWTTMAGREFLQYPMDVSVKKMNDFLKAQFEGAEAAKWIIPSDQMNGAAFQYLVKPNDLRPADRMDVSYSVRYVGTNRQTFVTQTLSR